MTSSATNTALDQSIRRLGGEAAESGPPPSGATTAEQGGGESSGKSAPPPPALDVGWIVWCGSAEIEPEHRQGGIVVDACGAGSVVVLRDRLRQRRQEAWLEVWPVDDVNMADSYDPGSRKHTEAAKRACGAIYETIKTGRWSDAEEALLAAAAQLTARYAPERVA